MNSKKITDWKKSWWAILSSEFLGTIALVLWIIIPASVGFDSMNNWWSDIWALFFMKALWVAGFIVGIVYLLRPISVNLNPAVTIAEIGKGNDSIQLGSMKIAVQFAGGIIAGFIGYGIALSFNNADSSSLDAISPLIRQYDYTPIGNWYDNPIVVTSFEDISAPATFVVGSMFLEFLYTFALIGSIFYFNMHKDFRPIFIGLAVWVLVTAGLRTNNIALNPARLVGPAIARDVTIGAANADTLSYTSWMWVYLIPELLAGFVFYGIETNKQKKSF